MRAEADRYPERSRYTVSRRDQDMRRGGREVAAATSPPEPATTGPVLGRAGKSADAPRRNSETTALRGSIRAR